MADSMSAGAGRHAILDLSPLELDCMNALWPTGEATVRQIREALRPIRPRAYTTIMTILDRLAQKGIVQRRKAGRAWVYRAGLSADQARSHAVSQVVDGFFGGSTGALASHLTGQRAVDVPANPARPMPAARAIRAVKTESEASGNPENPAAQSPEAPAPAGLDTALL
jgi:BlaI family penicillinase repressor